MKHKKIDMAHLHLHSSYSELDAISKIPDIVSRAIEYGHEQIALTDHGTIAGVPEFYNECIKQGIKPIIASEFYMMPDAAKARADKNRKNHHLIILAMDQEGWTNIKKLTTKANEKFYYAPRVDYEDLREHSNGLICLTACIKGIVPYMIMEKDYDEALKNAHILKSIYGDRFYFELQDGGLDVQIEVNKVMRRMASKLDITVVACQDAHYIDRNDVEAHEGIWAIRTGHTFDAPIGYGKGRQFRPYYSTREYWLKDAHHMLNEELTTEDGSKRMTSLNQSEIEETMAIAARIGDVKIEKKMHLPKYEFIPDIKSYSGCATVDSCGQQHYHPGDIEDGEVVDLTSFNYMMELVIKGYERVFRTSWLDAPSEYKKRILREMSDVKDAKLADYFLIVWDVVTWARSEGIRVGPGRGSAAGALISYCLSITGIDPMLYGLIWERFYNAGRKGSLADIDLDFSKRNRGRVIDYIRARFGEDRVAQMVTFNRLMPKAALKDSAKILGKAGMSFEDANVMTRNVGLKCCTIEEALEESERLQQYEKDNPRLFALAKKLQGCQKSRGKHAAGVIISDEPFSEGGVPLRWNTKDKCQVTEFDGDTLDSLGYLKMDVLGLKTMDVLEDIERDVNGQS